MKGQSQPHMDNHALKERLSRPRTSFAPGTRIRMNVVPMVLCLAIPFCMFLFCSGIFSFGLPYQRPGLSTVLVILAVLMCVASVMVAIWARKNEPEPTWFAYLALMVCLGCLLGCLSGSWIYVNFLRPFKQIHDLKELNHVDVAKERGQNLMDAGIIHFAESNHIEGHMAWHFKHRSLYCVAPLVAQGPPSTLSYDFWAVGKDCCALSSSDFRCGQWNAQGATGAIRVMDSEDLAFYRLAVQQAETLYDISATHPVFVYWSEDPSAQVKSWKAQAFHHFAINSLGFLCLCTIGLCWAVWAFAWLGRTHKHHTMDHHGMMGMMGGHVPGLSHWGSPHMPGMHGLGMHGGHGGWLGLGAHAGGPESPRAYGAL